jgi:hypothetical protein
VEGRPDLPETSTFFRIVTANYFETMGIGLRAGRGFEISDRGSSDLVVIVNKALVDKYFPGENPIGRRVGGGFDGSWRIVGVVDDAAEGKLTDPPAPARYYLAGQAPWFGSAAVLVIRTTDPDNADAVLDGVRRAVQGAAPQLAVQGTTTISRVFDRAVGPARQIMTLLALLSGLALVLGAIGIYGVISHFVGRRKRDWAIRVALGLPGSRVVALIVRQGVALVAVGIVLGALGTVALGRLLASFLFGVSAIDPIAFGAASLALLAIGVAAALVPAWRAGATDPAGVLREQ